MNSHITEELLVKYLLGEATIAEQEQVQNWLGNSEENRKEYYRFKTIWEESKFVAATSTVDENSAWEKFKARTEKQPIKSIPLPGRNNRLRIAAAIILLLGGGLLIYSNFFKGNDTYQVSATSTNDDPVNVKLTDTDSNTDNITTTRADEAAQQQEEVSAVANDLTQSEKPLADSKSSPSRFIDVKYQPALGKSVSHRSRQSICNTTPCPIEICIIQKVKCPGDNEASAISTCSILAPDESGQLHYKSFDHITKSCNTDVEEIRIRRVSTGETIVLNAHSKPTTARDFFNYINGEKKGDILAGMFHKDCNNHADDCGLIFNNDYGIIMQ